MAKRVLLISDYTVETVRGGSERMIARHLHALIAAGYRVSLLSRQPTPSAPLRIELANGVVEHRLPYSGDRGPVGLLQMRREAANWWRAHGGSFDLALSEHPFTAWALLAAGCRLPRLHACYSFAFEEYATRHALDWNAKHALTVAAMRRIEARVYGQASHLLVLSDYTRRRLHEAFDLRDNIAVASGGALPLAEPLLAQRNTLRAELGWQGPVVVTLRNLVPRTGVDLLVQTAAILRRRQPDLRWVVIGNGALAEGLKCLASDLGMADRIEFAGFLPEAEVQRRLVAADLFLLPTRSLEGFGLVTVEANMAGLPVVATPVGAIPEVIARLPGNHLAASAAPADLATAIAARLAGPADADERMRLCRQATAAFDWSEHDQRLLALLGELGG